MADLLSRKTYRQVLKRLEEVRKQHLQDRLENPGLLPAAYGMVLSMDIEHIIRENHEPCPRVLPGKVLEFLVTKGLLVHYAGDYTFPTSERLPTDQEIRERTKEWLQ